MTSPTLSAAAVAHLDGRPLVLRISPRHGCCGGHAYLPVAEVGPPADLDGYDRVEIDGVACFVDTRIGTPSDTWHVDAVGFSRLRRLIVDGASGIAPPVTGRSAGDPHPRG